VLLGRFCSCAASSSLDLSKGSGFPYTAWGYRRNERCHEPWSERSLETLCVNGSAIVAFEQWVDIAFCSRLSPSLHVSCMSVSVFTIVSMKWTAGNESCCTVSADSAQPLRGFWSFWDCETVQVSWEPGIE
jgi:hypothetical protein